MCGLVGVYSKDLEDKMKKAFSDMLLVDAVRGEDSTGVAIGKPSHLANGPTTYEVKKSLGNPFDFFAEHNHVTKGRVLTYAKCNVMLGHNRYATSGKITKENAHPFEFQHIIGAHNGTILLSSIKEFDGFAEYDVDSQILYQHLNNHGLDAVWDKVDGAMALSWIDKRDDSLNLARNTERTLFYAITKDGKNVMWASEGIFLYFGAFRHGVKIDDVQEVKPNLHHKFSYDAAGIIVVETKELKPFVRVIPPFRSSAWGWTGQQGGWDDWSDTTTVSKRTEAKKEAETVTFQIEEIHKQQSYCFASGTLADSDEKIRVFIPNARVEEAEKKIVGRGKETGYYVTTAARVSQFDGHKWFVNWHEVNWVKHKNEKDNVVEFDYSTAPWYDKNQRLSKGAFMVRTENGCDCCRMAVTWDDRNDLLWATKDEFYCKHCRTSPIVQDWIQQAYGQAKG